MSFKKTLLIGRGVISTQYGWALEKAGKTIVEYYVKPGRKAEFGETVTLNIYDARSSIRGTAIQEVWPIKIIEEFDCNHDYDLIIVSVQHYQFKKVAEFLADRIGKATVLIFNNFWEEPLVQVANFPANQLVWGFPRAGGGFTNQSLLQGSLFGDIVIGTFGGAELSERSIAVMELFESAGFKIKVTKDFRSWLFGHFAMSAAMFGTLRESSLLEAMQTREHWKNVIANGKELIPLLEARNVDLSASPDLRLFSLPPWFLSIAMIIAIKCLPSLKRSIGSHANPQETKSYCKDVVNMAEEMHIYLPRFEANKSFYEQ